MDALQILADVVLLGLLGMLVWLVVRWFRRDRGESEEY